MKNLTCIAAALVLLVGCQETPSFPESSAAEFNQTIESSPLVLAKFGAPWCGPCREVDRELGKLAAVAGEEVDVVLVNVDDEPELADKYEIRSIPRIMLFKNGDKIKDHTGYVKFGVMQGWVRSAAAEERDAEVQNNPLADS